MLMLNFPDINPIAIDLGIIQVHWYGLMYFIAFVLFLQLGKYRIKNYSWIKVNEKILDDLFFYGAIGVVIGGRLGYILFYQPNYYFTNPLEIFAIWKGGMSFHGGLIGVVASTLFISYRFKIFWLELTDFIAPMVPIGLGLGRIGNFINQELWGRPTDFILGIVFPNIDNLIRHPSQIYQFLSEGVLLFVLLWVYSQHKHKIGKVSGLFLIIYGVSRFITEFFREPDQHIGLIATYFTMGQLLSIPMIILGITLMNLKFNNNG